MSEIANDITSMMKTARKMDPDLYAKVDAIAEMIDPGAFARWHNCTGPDAELVPLTTRQEYMQARARNTAYRILQYLGHAPDTFDWLALFEAHYGEGVEP